MDAHGPKHDCHGMRHWSSNVRLCAGRSVMSTVSIWPLGLEPSDGKSNQRMFMCASFRYNTSLYNTQILIGFCRDPTRLGQQHLIPCETVGESLFRLLIIRENVERQKGVHGLVSHTHLVPHPVWKKELARDEWR